MQDQGYGTLKSCSRCETAKPLEEFSLDRSRRDGRKCNCRDCDKARCADYDKLRRDRSHKTCSYCTRYTNGPRFCGPACKELHACERRSSPIVIKDCRVCRSPLVVVKGDERFARGILCSDECRRSEERRRYDPAKERAKRGKRMRAIKLAHTDVTAAHIRQLYKTSKRCGLCNVKLTADPTQPNSREVDHIIPINVGGTHTIGNLRVICRACNLKRPKDGSDVTDHQPTLWAVDVKAAAAIAATRPETGKRRYGPSKTEWRKHAAVAAAEARKQATRQAAERRAAQALRMVRDGNSFDEAAAALGYAHATSARGSVDYFFPGEIIKLGLRESLKHPRIDRAIDLRKAGWTWSAIASHLGWPHGKAAARAVRGRGIDLAALRGGGAS